MKKNQLTISCPKYFIHSPSCHAVHNEGGRIGRGFYLLDAHDPDVFVGVVVVTCQPEGGVSEGEDPPTVQGVPQVGIGDPDGEVAARDRVLC